MGLFQGRLAGNVSMDWYMRPVQGAQDFDGFTTPSDDKKNRKKIRISLNGVALLLDVRGSVGKIIETVSHEMIVSEM